MSKSIPKKPRQLVTLATLDAMPAVPVQHLKLSDMPLEQLSGMATKLHAVRTNSESLSGTCAVLAGLVLIETKARLKHGKYLPWLSKHFGKSRAAAGQYVAVAKAFRKCKPKVTFEQMTLALMDGGEGSANGESLDLTHPIVSAVAKWTAGRSFYQLRAEEVTTGGAREKEDGDEAPEQTEEEKQQRYEAACLEDFTHVCEQLEVLGFKWTLRNEAELDHFKTLLMNQLEQVERWLKTPKTKRKVPTAASFFEDAEMETQTEDKE